jgi:hypothetical protein
MRAPRTAATGTSGQSFVKARFESLDWGVSTNDQHDLGTDLWLMARDARGFELRLLVGVQVKSGASWFDEPELDEPEFDEPEFDGDEVVGWWFRKADDDHFRYWTEHSVPHILVLHRPSDGECFWVHLTADRFSSTGKGRKILVSATSTVDREHIGDLVAVATSKQPVAEWQGSAWTPSSVEPLDRLRYALLVPRLVAPHPNNRPPEVSAEQAVALLTQLRVRGLERLETNQAELDHEVASGSGDWTWTFYGALWRWVIHGELEMLGEATRTAAASHQRAAATAALASAYYEIGDVDLALEILDSELARDDHHPVDHAWLVSHRARCVIERGQLEDARALALGVFHIGRTKAGDPTAAVVAGTMAEIIFTSGDWNGDELAQSVQVRDNVASWWRSQTLVSGLSSQFAEDFRTWSGSRSYTWGAEDTAWIKMRSAMLLSGYAADSASWRHAAGLLARRLLMTTTEDEGLVSALDTLRVAGAYEHLNLAIGRLCERGPTKPLATVACALDLSKSTRTSLRCDLGLLIRAANVLTPEAAGNHATWLMNALRNTDDLEQTLRPTFFLNDDLVHALSSVCVALDASGENDVREFLTTLPPQPELPLARSYAKLLAALVDEQWTDDQVARLASRPDGDHAEFLAAVEALGAARSTSARDALLGRVSAGDLNALQSYGSVTDLPPLVARELIRRLAQSITQPSGQPFGVSGAAERDLLRTLVLLNAWHPDEADWEAVIHALSDVDLHPGELAAALDLLTRLAQQVPTATARELDPVLRGIAERVVDEPVPFRRYPNLRSQAELARACLSPESLTEADLRRLIRGDADDRAAAAQIVIHRRDATSLTLVAALAQDEEPLVRTRIAHGLCEWLMTDDTAHEVLPLLRDLLSDEGLAVGNALSMALDADLVHEGVRPLLDMIVDHPSAIVRFRATTARSLLDQHSSDANSSEDRH